MRKYVVKFRIRSFHCTACDTHVEFSGNDPIVGTCPCGMELYSLPVESDAWVEDSKTVYDYKDRPQN